ncbi:hypothetical protein LUX33_34680 [Actinomadura madurae]|uniref:hypothetical protein n=1 Tax=Actinomadura madurae TaxID=1993 RepID=UPI0020D2325E|nr:hypothetical protein [Actinomadura madurae]MCP9953077.1 hypothetical protein [Actinomadura madurae]
MTERGPLTGVRGGPNPAEPSHSGDAPSPPGGPPEDLGAVRRTDALIESLAARRRAGDRAARPGPAPEGSPSRPPGERAADDPDPAVRLLHALITDVDDPDSGSGPGTAPPAPQGPGPRRRGPRTIVALGVAGAVLASSGVAAAGGVADQTTASPAPSTAGAPDVPRAGTDTGAATRERPRPPARSSPEPGGVTAPGGRERKRIDRFKRRLDPVLRRRPEPPERPGGARPDGELRPVHPAGRPGRGRPAPPHRGPAQGGREARPPAPAPRGPSPRGLTGGWSED